MCDIPVNGEGEVQDRNLCVQNQFSASASILVDDILIVNENIDLKGESAMIERLLNEALVVELPSDSAIDLCKENLNEYANISEILASHINKIKPVSIEKKSRSAKSSEVLTSSPVRMKIAEAKIAKIEKGLKTEILKQEREIERQIKKEKLNNLTAEKQKIKEEKIEAAKIKKEIELKEKEEKKRLKVAAAKIKKERLEKEKELKKQEKQVQRENKKRQLAEDRAQMQFQRKKARSTKFIYDKDVDFRHNIFSQIEP